MKVTYPCPRVASPLFFHNPEGEDGFISNWFVAPFVADGILCQTVEQAFMLAKARFFGDVAIETALRNEKKPKKCKQQGRSMAGFNAKTWNEASKIVIADLIRAKFDQHPELRRKLLATGNRVLAEAPQDPIRAIGMLSDDARAWDPRAWTGDNCLGGALSFERNHIRNSVPFVAVLNIFLFILNNRSLT